MAKFSHNESKIGVFLRNSKNLSDDINPKGVVNVLVYRITGKQLFFNVDESFCEECDIIIRHIIELSERMPDINIKLTVKPWLDNIFRVLLKGGWHPPVVLVGGKRISQGVVPSDDQLTKAIINAAAIERSRRI